jgi:tRNA pseudouridine-54 N-methylase
MASPAVVASGETYRSYYYLNGQRAAMREVDASSERVLYLLGDHPRLRGGRHLAAPAWR